jgi:hypothetical protein
LDHILNKPGYGAGGLKYW